MRILVAIVLSAVTTAGAQAQSIIQTWETLSDPGLFLNLLPGADYLYGTGDELGGSNPLGHSAGGDYGPNFSLPPNLVFGVWEGNAVQRYYPSNGNFDILEANASGTFNCVVCATPIVDDPFTASLAPDTNSGTPLGLLTWNYVLNFELSNGSIYTRTGTSYVLPAGADPVDLFGPDIGAHFLLVSTSALLPADATLLYFIETFEAISGIDAGYFGNQYGTMYLADQVVVPLPAAAWFLGPALLLLHFRQRAS